MLLLDRPCSAGVRVSTAESLLFAPSPVALMCSASCSLLHRPLFVACSSEPELAVSRHWAVMSGPRAPHGSLAPSHQAAGSCAQHERQHAELKGPHPKLLRLPSALDRILALQPAATTSATWPTGPLCSQPFKAQPRKRNAQGSLHRATTFFEDSTAGADVDGAPAPARQSKSLTGARRSRGGSLRGSKSGQARVNSMDTQNENATWRQVFQRGNHVRVLMRLLRTRFAHLVPDACCKHVRAPTLVHKTLPSAIISHG